MSPQTPTLIDFLCQRGALQPDELAYRFLLDGEAGGRTEEWSYSHLLRRTQALAACLQERWSPGERALLLYAPGLEYVAAYFGCLAAGIIAVPAYPPEPGRLERTLPRLQAIAADAEVKVVLTTSALLDLAGALRELAPDLAAREWLATDTVEPERASAWRRPDLGPESVAFLQYTSGSTGNPKGVVITHGNLTHNTRQIASAFQTGERWHAVGWLPLFHDMGLIGHVLTPLHARLGSTLMSPLDFLQRPLRWLRAISHYQAQVSGGPNFAYELCARRARPEDLEALDLRCWKLAYTGAEPVRASMLERFARVFEPSGFRQESFYPCYGLAEATLFATGGRAGRPPVIRGFQRDALSKGRLRLSSEAATETRLVGCGHPWLGQDVVIVSPQTRRRCRTDEIGEVWLRGPSMARGYWNQPQETADTFGAFLADTGEGPFLRTGDLGCLQDGELYVTGRLKDLLVIRGLNHYPQDLEHTVERCHPSIRPGGCAAFSVEVEDREELVIAAEVAPLREAAELEGALTAIRTAISSGHGLQLYASVLLAPRALPKTSSGKVQRRACRSSFLEGSLEAMATRYFPVAA